MTLEKVYNLKVAFLLWVALHAKTLFETILVNGNEGTHLNDGRLADLAPSLLAMMGIDQPARMTGKTLFTAA